MTKVALTERYRHGCEACAEQLQRLSRWIVSDPSVTSLLILPAKHCEHEQAALALVPNPPPPPAPATLFEVPTVLHGTGYDEPV